MTGIEVSVRRPRGLVNVEIDEATPYELEGFIEDHYEDAGMAWRLVRRLARWVRENVVETVDPDLIETLEIPDTRRDAPPG